MGLRKYQTDIIADCREALRSYRRVLMVMPTGCHSKGSLIMMSDGSLKKVEDVRIGDTLMGDNKVPKTVLSLHYGIGIMARVNPRNKASFVVNMGHIFSLRSKYNESTIEISVEQYLKKSDEFKEEYCLYSIYDEMYDFDVEVLELGNYYGFHIDGNHLYCDYQGIVHHNSGKTRTASEIARCAFEKGRKVLIVSHRSEIMSQNGGAFQRAGLNVRYIDPRNRKIPQSNVCSAMAQTLKRRVEKPEWVEWIKGLDFVFIDEAHTCDADFLHSYFSDRCYVVGLTATPRRYGHQRQLGSLYGAMVTGVTVKDLIKEGYLSPARHFSVIAPKLDGVAVDYKTGDYNQSAMARKFEDKRLYTGVVNEFLRLTPTKKAIFFCCSSKQTIELTQELCDKGISAKYLLSGEFDTDEEYSGQRQAIIESFKNNEFQVLVNLGIAVAGFDVPDIEVVVLCFSTISLTKYLQAIGRGSRIADGKTEFYILDAGENYRKHGAYDSDRIWSLWHDEKIGTGETPMKLCDSKKKDINGKFGCDTFVPMTCSYCPCCGFKFHTKEDEYQLRLEEIASSDTNDGTIAKFCASKKLEGWKTNRILVQVLLSNAGREKEAFRQCCEALQLKPSYWYFFKENIWKNVKQKRV